MANTQSMCTSFVGSTVTKTGQNLTITFPPMGATESVLRIS